MSAMKSINRRGNFGSWSREKGKGMQSMVSYAF